MRSTGGTVFYYSSDLSKPDEAVVDEAGKKGNLAWKRHSRYPPKIAIQLTHTLNTL